ncbi:MAG: indole-3-glycerol phosphate synthase TrpC [Rhodospirillales bacterium]|nr:indole-3-glycerol phosphate synthase TrpC [Rhodospirillales bacterium]
MSDVLEKICADTRQFVAARKSAVSEAELSDLAAAQTAPRGFAARLQTAADAGGFGLIAEVKKASPSKGLIREDFDPASLARAYELGGATCLSVLTDVPYFQGDDKHLISARAAANLPVIRKDFMIDSYQILESRALGADCILLIMAALSDSEAETFYGQAVAMGMDVLVEVHNNEELTRATRLGPRLLGINNRNLKTLNVDLSTTIELAAKAPEDALLISESGLYTHQDLLRIANAGVSCFLVGESLMRQSDVTAAVQALVGPTGFRKVSA